MCKQVGNPHNRLYKVQIITKVLVLKFVTNK